MLVKKIYLGLLYLVLCTGCSGPSNNLYVKVADDSLSLGNSDAALVFYDKALKQNPNNLKAKVGRVESLINLGRLDMAMHDINDGLRIDPKCEPLLYSKGKILLLTGNVTEATKIFKAMPRNYKSLNALGTIYDAAFKYKLAQQYYQKAIAINDQYADAYGNLGLSMVLSGENVYQGIEYIERATALPGSSTAQKNNLALAYGIAGEYGKALAVYEEIMPHQDASLKVEELKKLSKKKR